MSSVLAGAGGCWSTRLPGGVVVGVAGWSEHGPDGNTGAARHRSTSVDIGRHRSTSVDIGRHRSTSVDSAGRIQAVPGVDER